MEGDFYTLFQSQRGERLINIPVFPIYGTSLPPPLAVLLSMLSKEILGCGGKSTSLTLHLSPPSVSRCTVHSFCQPVTAKTFLFSLSSWQKWKPSPNECPFLRPPPPSSPYPILESFRKFSRLFSKIDSRESFIILFFTTKRQS